jgi:hypothetical protein
VTRRRSLAEPSLLLLTEDDKDMATEIWRRYASALADLGLSQTYGVYVAPVSGAWGIYLGRHDGGEIEPDDSARVALARVWGNT